MVIILEDNNGTMSYASENYGKTMLYNEAKKFTDINEAKLYATNYSNIFYKMEII